jgi:predicted nucleic acid-binding protein
MNRPNYLLDVSALVALLWKNHPDHQKTAVWCRDKHLVVCPITELGFLRVVTSPAYNASMSQARSVLLHFLENESPAFICADLRTLEGTPASTSSKTTDWYLANLAQVHGIKWATLDARAAHANAELVV